MKKLTKLLALILALLMVASLAACGGSSDDKGGSDANADANAGADADTDADADTSEPAGESITLKFSSINPGEDNKYAVCTRAWFNSITEATDGAITFDEYYSSTACEAEDALAAAQDGIVDIAEYYSVYWGEQFPLWDLFNLPFQYVYPDGYQYANAMAEMIQIYPEFIEQVEAKNVHFVLAHGDAANQLMGNEPVYSIADIQGDIINVSSAIDQTLLEDLGASVEMFGPADVYDNMSKGVLDAFMFSYCGAGIWGTADVTKYVTNVMGTHATWLYVMNNDTYNSLPDEWKQYFDIEYTDDFMVALGYQFYNDESLGNKALAENCTIIGTDEITDYDQWVAAAEPLYQDWIDTANEMGYDGEAMYETWQGLLEKYAEPDWTGEKEWLEGFGVTVPETWEY